MNQEPLVFILQKQLIFLSTSGGQFAMAAGGHIALASGGQFKPVAGGQFEWIFHAELITEINLTAEKLKDTYLRCFHCGELLLSFNIQKLNYIKCQSCNCLIDGSDLTRVTVKIDDPKLHNLSINEFGMDYLVVNTTHQKRHFK